MQYFIIILLLNFQDPGVLFSFDGERVFFRGTVTVFSADNLAAWYVGGYKALASSSYSENGKFTNGTYHS